MKYYTLLSLLLISFPLCAQESGYQYPLIKGYGGILDIDDADVRPDPKLTYNIVIDLANGSRNNKDVNFHLERVARLINLHVIGGVKPENLKVVIVAHAGATATMLNDEKYTELYGRNNPNTELLDALTAAGMELMICGQSVRGRRLEKSDLHPAVQVATSMLTAVTTLQLEGYAMLQF